SREETSQSRLRIAWKTSRRPSVQPAHWTKSLTDVSTAMPTLNWSATDPVRASTGKRKFTWYPPTVPGSPTAPSTSAGLPFTLTSAGAGPTAGGLEGNVWPGSTAGWVGQRRLANNESTSPGAAGLAAVTSLKSDACVPAGPLAVSVTRGPAG